MTGASTTADLEIAITAASTDAVETTTSAAAVSTAGDGDDAYCFAVT
jgi:hypothetical protein